VETRGSAIGGASATETAGGMEGSADVRPARALAAVLVAGGAMALCAMPAVVALGAGRVQFEPLATGLGGLAAVVGGVKLTAAASAVAGRWWSDHTARLATVRAS